MASHDSAPAAVATDRISNLPDGVLAHILSFLSTEQSVRTRVLSTRWKHLFSLVPVLHFYFWTSTSNTEKSQRFLAFVDWVFSTYDPGHMRKFYYESVCSLFKSNCSLSETSRLFSWISKSIRLGVQELELSVSLPEPMKLPQSIFTCATITRLILKVYPNNNFILDVPEDACLPRLRTLYILGVSFIDGASACRLFRSCPVLEDLFFVEPPTTLDISVPTLKTLTIGGYGDNNNFNLVLNVPNLENFYCSDMERGSFSIQSFKVLSKASISFQAHSSNGYNALEHLLNLVCQVKELEFRGFTLESFQLSGRSLPLFCNLTSLVIDDVSCIDSEVLLDVLDKTPHLEVLEVDNEPCGFSAEDYPESSYHIQFSEERVPACVSLHLKEVIFGGFIMLDNEFKLVDYLLKNANVLITFKISFRGSLEKQVELRKKVTAFSRSSKACEIELNLVTEDLDTEDDE